MVGVLALRLLLDGGHVLHLNHQLILLVDGKDCTHLWVGTAASLAYTHCWLAVVDGSDVPRRPAAGDRRWYRNPWGVAADEKTAILKQLTDPTPCSKPESALNGKITCLLQRRKTNVEQGRDFNRFLVLVRGHVPDAHVLLHGRATVGA